MTDYQPALFGDPAPRSGEALKQQGMELAERAAAEWLDAAWTAMYELARTGSPFTSEDLVARVGLPRVTASANRNNAVGAVFAAAARKKVIRKVGVVNATRPELHAASLTVWRGGGGGR